MAAKDNSGLFGWSNRQLGYIIGVARLPGGILILLTFIALGSVLILLLLAFAPTKNNSVSDEALEETEEQDEGTDTFPDFVRQVSDENGEPGSDSAQLSIVSLVSASSHFSPEDIELNWAGREFYLSFPEDLAQNFAEEEIHQDFFFRESFTLAQLADDMQIPELPDLVEKHRRLAAWDFIHRTDGTRFNKEQLGLYRARPPREYGYSGRIRLEAELYKTDTFTDKVMTAVRTELLEAGYSLTVSSLHEIAVFSPFTTSFELGLIAVSSPENSDKQVLTHQQQVGDQTNPTISAGGILLSRDLSGTTEEGRVDIVRWMQRILREELGLTSKVLAESKSIWNIHDLYLDRTNLKLGLLACLETSLDPAEFSELTKARLPGALIPLTMDQLNTLLMDGTLSFREQFMFSEIHKWCHNR